MRQADGSSFSQLFSYWLNDSVCLSSRHDSIHVIFRPGIHCGEQIIFQTFFTELKIYHLFYCVVFCLLLILISHCHVSSHTPCLLWQMVKIMEEYLDDYNQINTAQMKLVLFTDAVRHVSRISRVIRQPLGNALLLGVGGSGRQSLTRLAAHMWVIINLSLAQLATKRGFGNVNRFVCDEVGYRCLSSSSWLGMRCNRALYAGIKIRSSVNCDFHGNEKILFLT